MPEKLGVSLPLEDQAKTTTENRLDAGIQAQVDIFGESTREFYKSGTPETVHINRWIAQEMPGEECRP